MIALITSGGTSPRNAVGHHDAQEPEHAGAVLVGEAPDRDAPAGGERACFVADESAIIIRCITDGSMADAGYGRTSAIQLELPATPRRAVPRSRGVPAGGRVRLLGGGAAGAGALRAEAAAAGAEVGVDLGEDPRRWSARSSGDIWSRK